MYGGAYRWIMNSLKSAARQAKQRLRTDFWGKCQSDITATTMEAERMGRNAGKVKSSLYTKVKSVIKGETPDEFYIKVKTLLDEHGEVSDAIGRLTDKEYFATLGYEERQRYTMELSAKYLAALEKYRREKESGI